MKKNLKITLIVLIVLVGLVVLDTLQAKILNNSPLLKIRKNLNGDSTYYIDKGLLVNHYHCTNEEEKTLLKDVKYTCPENKNDGFDNKQDEKITWDEIINGTVDSEKLLQNIDIDILEQVAANLQDLIEEEKEEEKANPEIVIKEGWVRIFNKDKYKDVVRMKNMAVKPLFYILYKSNNNGLYEYLCAKALEDITSIGSELNDNNTKKWTNAKEYLDLFIKEISD